MRKSEYVVFMVSSEFIAFLIGLSVGILVGTLTALL